MLSPLGFSSLGFFWGGCAAGPLLAWPCAASVAVGVLELNELLMIFEIREIMFLLIYIVKNGGIFQVEFPVSLCYHSVLQKGGDRMKKSLGSRPLLYPTPTWVIGSYDASGKPNMMTVAWGGVCSSTPPCVAVSIRKATYTHGNITSRKAFTVNIPSASFVKEADHFGIVSGKNEDKLEATGLTPVKSDKVDAPYIKEFPVILECKLIQTSEIGIHTHFIGEIMDVKAEESVLGSDGLPDILKVEPIIYAPESRGYYGVGQFLAKAFSVGK